MRGEGPVGSVRCLVGGAIQSRGVRRAGWRWLRRPQGYVVGCRDAAAVRAGTGTKCARFRGGYQWKAQEWRFYVSVPISLAAVHRWRCISGSRRLVSSVTEREERTKEKEEGRKEIESAARFYRAVQCEKCSRRGPLLPGPCVGVRACAKRARARKER